jgi:lysophospholipid acyltransferase
VYDIISLIFTHIAFSYIVVPFVILSLGDSIKFWARLYFFVHIGIAVCMGVFNPPCKRWLIAQQKKRLGRLQVHASVITDSLHQDEIGPLGLPSNPDGDIREIRIEMSQKRNEIVTRRNATKKGV